MTIAEAVKASKSFSGMAKGSIKAAQEMLMPGEEVLFAFIANVAINPVRGALDAKILSTKGKLNGVVAVTTNRVLFVHSVLGVGTSKQLPIGSIRSVDDTSEMLGCVLRIVGPTEMFVIDCTPQHLTAMKNAIAEALDRKRAASAAAPAGPGTASTADQLRELKKLYDEGILTAEEFAAKKAKILGI